MCTRPAVLVALVLLLLLPGCATNPVTGHPDFVLLTEDQEIELGRANDPKIRAQFGVYDDAKLQGYVQQVGARVAAQSHRPGLIYRFTVLDTPDVNAFALPGGYIYITRGILAYLQSEAELAAVLGHEIGHVTARHSVRQYSAATAGSVAAALLLKGAASQDLFNVIGNALLSGYGREHELQSDRLGAEYLARTGYDPKAMIQVIEVLKNQEEFEKQRAQTEGREPRVYHGLFASHPSADQRLQEVVAEANQYGKATDPRVARADYLAQIDGLIYGDGPKAGVRYANRFYHRDMNFALSFPEGWQLDNAPQAITAYSPGREAVMQVRAEDLNKRMTPAEYLRTRLKLTDLKDEKPVPGSALPSHSAVTTLNTPFGRRETRVVVVYQDQRAFLFLGAAKNERALYDTKFLASAASLHGLDEKERRIANGLRLRIMRPRAGDSFTQLAARTPLSSYAEPVLRLINDEYPDGQPTPGEPLKIIE